MSISTQDLLLEVSTLAIEGTSNVLILMANILDNMSQELNSISEVLDEIIDNLPEPLGEEELHE